MVTTSDSNSGEMELISIKVCVIFGLLFLTFTAACLPVTFILPPLETKNGYGHSSSRLHRLLHSIQRRFSCLVRRRKKESNLSSSTELSDEDEIGENGDAGKRSKGRKTTLFLDVMNCFSGGVFLGTSFLALMPEVREIFDDVGIKWPKFYSDAKNSTNSTDAEEQEGTLMPLTEILVTCGLFLILCLEQIVHSIMDRNKHAEKDRNKDTSSSEENSRRSIIQNGTAGERTFIKLTAATPVKGALDTEVVFSDDIDVNVIDPNHNRKEEAAPNSNEINKQHYNDSIVRSLILVTTLSMHSLLEGLAIGLQRNASSALSIFVAVLFHKSLMAFSMGNNLVLAGQSIRNTVIAAAVLALTSPVGIAIGIVMKETRDGTELVNGILQSIATGTFLFITFFEVLSKEFSNHKNRVYKTIAFILGYCCILAVMFTQHGGG